MLAESGDPARYRDGKSRRNYAGEQPVAQAFSALTASPGAHAFYDEQRAAGHGHNDALQRLANRLIGIIHGCLKTRTPYMTSTPPYQQAA